MQQFHSKNGRAYLFKGVVNVCFGPKEERLMTTGVHIVRDAFCVGCMLPVGWKYVNLTILHLYSLIIGGGI